MSLSRSEISLLTAGPLFRGVSEELLQALAGTEGASLVRFDSGVVYSPRHFRRSLAVVLSGQLQVTKGALAVSVLGPGDLFGAAALYSDEPEFASTVTAKGPSRCLMLEQRLVDRLLAEQSQIRENYLRYLTGRIRFLSGRLRTLAQPGVEGKLARYLLPVEGDALTLSATALCQRLGVGRATLYRAFETLEGAGAIAREGKTIRILSRDALKNVISENRRES